MTNKLKDKLIFRLKERFDYFLINSIRKFYWSLQGMEIGKNSKLNSFNVTWPHKVNIGDNCTLEKNIYFKFDGIWEEEPSIIISNRCFIGFGTEFNIRKKVLIENDCLIASGCKFIDHDHGFKDVNIPMNKQTDGKEAEIYLERDVWLGVNVVVLKGVRISKGAIIAANSVITKNIPEYEIWGGIPAKKIGSRK